jgi:hypothetical protein
MAGPCEPGNDFSNSIKGSGFFDQLNDYQLLEDSVPVIGYLGNSSAGVLC